MNIQLSVDEDKNGKGTLKIEGLNEGIEYETFDPNWAAAIAPKAQKKGLAETLQEADDELAKIFKDKNVQMLFSRVARLMKKQDVVTHLLALEKAVSAEDEEGLVDADTWANFLSLNETVESELPANINRETYNSLMGFDG